MIITRRHIARRTFLRGMGAVVALPVLDAMTPAFAAPSKPPLRLAFKYIPNGAVLANWTPADTGPGFALSRILQPLQPFYDQTLVITGLTQKEAEARGDGGGQHSRAASGFLTGVHIKKTAVDLHGGVSADQIAARAIGSQTKFPSLELGCDDTRTIGNCDNGYSCAYTNSISWRTPSSPMPPENNPRQVFERLFGTEDFSLSIEARARRDSDRKSILDMVQDDAGRLMGRLGTSDRRKIDEYLYSIREVEKRIEHAENEPYGVLPTIEKPAGIPIAYSEYAKLMFDLQFLAFQADLTRIGTFMYGREVSVRMYDEIGMSEGHHPLSHHGKDPRKLELLTQINTFHVGLFAHLLERLKSTPEGDGSMLDHVMVVYGGGISDGDRHTHENLPIVLVGGRGAGLKGGRHVVYDKTTPLTNLYMTLLDRVGVREESIGDSTGKLELLGEV
jgi:hypothetical protein